MRILVLGNGWLGNKIKDFLDCEISDERLGNITVHDLIEFDVVINTAAKTDIDWCEENKYEALNANALDAREIARICHEQDIKYVFISSACIFESVDENDWKYEDSVPNPACFYAKTKAIAEELIQEANPDSLIVRIRLPLSEEPHPRNTITKILTYPKLQTNQETVTVIEDMLPLLDELIQRKYSGIVHLVNAGTISPAEIGDVMNLHDFTPVQKSVMDDEMKEAGRAKRVTTLVHSSIVPELPEISKRIIDIEREYKLHI